MDNRVHFEPDWFRERRVKGVDLTANHRQATCQGRFGSVCRQVAREGEREREVGVANRERREGESLRQKDKYYGAFRYDSSGGQTSGTKEKEGCLLTLERRSKNRQ